MIIISVDAHDCVLVRKLAHLMLLVVTACLLIHVHESVPQSSCR